ncbi:MAG: Gfo/Idh/MocA family oxidoreductase [Armatimonadetes bacterium]|nr:Gfo/Idh/MocA family oxidoreductase [Armatimonadota bacterium]
MAETVKIGIIGVGQIGKSHVRNYQEIPGAEIVAIADINEEEARRVAEEIGVKHVFTDFHELLAMDEIQAVDVCLHNNLHAPVSIAAMEAGKHVYCEKPLAGSYADARAMIETRERTGQMLYMQVNTVFSMETKAARRLIDDGHLGRIYYAKSSYYRRRGRPFVDGYGSPNFVQKAIAAGGALYDMGVYHIVQILYLLDRPEILTISGATHQEIDMYEDRREVSKYDVEELGLGFVRLGGGISFFIEEAWAINLGGTDGSKIAGSKGGVSLSPFAFHTTISDMEMDGTFDFNGAAFRWGKCVENFHAYDSPQHHWVAVLQGRVPLIDTAALGMDMMLIAEGIYLSQKLGREVTAQEVAEASVSTAVQGL